MSISLNFKKKTVLLLIVLSEIIIGCFALLNFYQKKIVHKTQDLDKITILKKENLVFPKESEYKHYFELKPNTKIVENPDWLGHEVKYTYNADGLNERFDYSVEKPDEVFRIIALGDSYTYGQSVNTEENWTEKLEDFLNKNERNQCGYKKFEVINLGMSSFDVAYIAKRYRDIGAKYKPDLIIWFESTTGFNRLTELIRSYADVCEDQIPESVKKQELDYCWNRASEEIRKKYSSDEVFNLTASNLDAFFKGLNQEKFLFFTYEEDTLADYQLEGLNFWKKRFPDVIFSTTPSIYKLNLDLADGHPNVEGHRIMASAIYDYLKNNFLKDCNLP